MLISISINSVCQDFLYGWKSCNKLFMIEKNVLKVVCYLKLLRMIHILSDTRPSDIPPSHRQLGIGLVSTFVHDYMHSVCLGVMKKLLYFSRVGRVGWV